MVSFVCNVCGERNTVERIEREPISCACESNVRTRAIIHLLSVELFDGSLALPDFPQLKEIKGLGLSDESNCADRLSQKFGYVNTFLDREPRFDITEAHPDQYGTYDFIMSADVFEHVRALIERAFEEACRLLKPNGMLCVSVPFSPRPETDEHFPDLHDFGVVQLSESVVLVNRTTGGEVQIFDDLVFHEDHESRPLEMRLFSQEDLRRRLLAAGFCELRFQTLDVPEFGIVLGGQWSLPFVARKQKFCLNGHAARQLAEAYHLRTTEYRNTAQRLAERVDQVGRLEAELAERGQWALKVQSELEERDSLVRRLQADLDERARWTLEVQSQGQVQMAALKRSRWIKLGRMLRLGPRIEP